MKFFDLGDLMTYQPWHGSKSSSSDYKVKWERKYILQVQFKRAKHVHFENFKMFLTFFGIYIF